MFLNGRCALDIGLGGLGERRWKRGLGGLAVGVGRVGCGGRGSAVSHSTDWNASFCQICFCNNNPRSIITLVPILLWLQLAVVAGGGALEAAGAHDAHTLTLARFNKTRTDRNLQASRCTTPQCATLHGA